MKIRWIPILPIMALAPFLNHPIIQATEYWGPEELAEQRAEAPAGFEGGMLPPSPGTDGLPPNYYMARFSMVAEFLTTLQVSDSTAPLYGGIMEGERNTLTIQTDNTSEAIWIWSHYTDLTGDTRYVPNIEAAWIYVMNYPAYHEEGGSGEFGYYRVYNCGWAMACEMEFRRVFGDSTYLWYGDSCASYVINNPLNLYGPEPYDILNGMVTGWAAGNLYAYGESAGDTSFYREAADIGSIVKEWAEGDPTARLGGWNWAMSGGAAFWGVVNSYFRHYPDGRRSWSETYDDYLQVYVESGNWQNAWNLWFALGHYTAWDTQGDLRRKRNHKGIVDFLITLDGDGDGGIGHSELSFHFNDQSWVTSYLGYMGLDPLLVLADVVLVPDTTTVDPGTILHFEGTAANNTGRDLPLEGWTEITLPDGSPFPRNPVLGPFPFTLPAHTSAHLSFDQLIPASAPAGTYSYRGAIGEWPSITVDLDDLPIEVTGGP